MFFVKPDSQPLFQSQHETMFLFAGSGPVIRVGLKQTVGLRQPVLDNFRVRAGEKFQRGRVNL
jgi:hypothetical protein